MKISCSGRAAAERNSGRADGKLADAATLEFFGKMLAAFTAFAARVRLG